MHRKDVQPIEMDIATAEFIRSEREKLTIRDAQHVMPIKQIPDLKWKFDENIDQVDSGPIFVQVEEVMQRYLPVTPDPTEVAELRKRKVEEQEQTKQNEITQHAATATVEAVENPEIKSESTQTIEAVGVETTEADEAVENETEITEISEVDTVADETTETNEAVNDEIETTDTPIESEDTRASTVNIQVPKAKSNNSVNNSFVTKFFAVLKPVANAMSSPIMRNSHF